MRLKLISFILKLLFPERQQETLIFDLVNEIGGSIDKIEAEVDRLESIIQAAYSVLPVPRIPNEDRELIWDALREATVRLEALQYNNERFLCPLDSAGFPLRWPVFPSGQPTKEGE